MTLEDEDGEEEGGMVCACICVCSCTYDQHRRPHHLRDALPQLRRGAWFSQTTRKFPGLRVSRSPHRRAPLCVNDLSKPTLAGRPLEQLHLSLYPRVGSSLLHAASLEQAPGCCGTAADSSKRAGCVEFIPELQLVDLLLS